MRRPITLVAKVPTARTNSTMIRMPTPGAARPTSRVASGAVKSSMIPKIHTSAAMLMTSGTVTKKPARKRRRSHCATGSPANALSPTRRERGDNNEPDNDPIPRKWRKSRAPHECEKRPNHDERCNERGDEPDADLDCAFRRERMSDFQQIVAERRSHRRYREKERKLRGRGPIQPHQHSADDCRAAARHTGDDGEHLAHADPKRATDRR